MTQKRVLLIDGDPLVYSCGFACEHIVYHVVAEDGSIMESFPASAAAGKRAAKKFIKEYGGELYEEKEVEPLKYVLSTLKQSINKMMDVCRGDTYEVYLSPKENFRDRLATIQKYKGNRDQLHKPVWYTEIREYLIKHHGAQVAEDIEADDAIGIRAAHGAGEPVVCSIDKDLNQIPGKHYNYRTGLKYFVPEEYAERFLYEQILAGDSVDNIAGLPKVSVGKATARLEDCGDYRREVLRAYAQHGFEGRWRSVVEETAKLIKILQREEEKDEKFWAEEEFLDIEADLSLDSPPTSAKEASSLVTKQNASSS